MKPQSPQINFFFLLQCLILCPAIEATIFGNHTTSSGPQKPTNPAYPEIGYSPPILIGLIIACAGVRFCLIAAFKKYRHLFFPSQEEQNNPMTQLPDLENQLTVSCDKTESVSEIKASNEINPNADRWEIIETRIAALKNRLMVLADTTSTEENLISIRQIIDQSESISLPSWFIDPISKTIMHDPHVTDDGHSYDKSNIECTKKNGYPTPLNGSQQINHIIPNTNLKLTINDFLEQTEHTIDSAEAQLQEIEASLKEHKSSSLSECMI